MMDQLSAVSSQLSVIKDNGQQTKDSKVRNPESGSRNPDITNQKDDLRKVARDMESLFAYQLLKVMRKSAETLSTDKKENGYDTYMSLFDMEVSKLLAERGLGLQDAIVKGLENAPNINDKNNGSNE